MQIKQKCISIHLSNLRPQPFSMSIILKANRASVHWSVKLLSNACVQYKGEGWFIFLKSQ